MYLHGNRSDELTTPTVPTYFVGHPHLPPRMAIREARPVVVQTPTSQRADNPASPTAAVLVPHPVEQSGAPKRPPRWRGGRCGNDACQRLGAREQRTEVSTGVHKPEQRRLADGVPCSNGIDSQRVPARP